MKKTNQATMTIKFPGSYPIEPDSFQIRSASPHYSAEAKSAVNEVLERGYTAEGPKAGNLENMLGDRLKRQFTTVSSSGTSALHLALEALGVGDDDEVIIPSYTCLAVMNAVSHTGASPVPADVDRHRLCLTEDSVKSHLNNKTAAIVLVHNFGIPANQPELYELDVPVVDDISTAIGATGFDEQPVGTNGTLAMGSMYATKLISAGFGGFVSTDDENLHQSTEDLKQYDQRDSHTVSYNYGLSDVLAALGLSQLKTLDQRLDQRQQIAEVYHDELAGIGALDRPIMRPGRVFYRYVVRTNDRNELAGDLRNAGIEAKAPVYKPLHRYRNRNDDDYPVTTDTHETALLLPCHADMEVQDAEYVAESTKQYFQ